MKNARSAHQSQKVQHTVERFTDREVGPLYEWDMAFRNFWNKPHRIHLPNNPFNATPTGGIKS